MPGGPLFPTRTGDALSDDAVAARLALYQDLAAGTVRPSPSRRLTPHVLRHTCAMNLLREGVDVAVIALWLGHADMRSTNAYLHADMTIKERALARTTRRIPAGRYRPPTPCWLPREPVIIPNNTRAGSHSADRPAWDRSGRPVACSSG